MEFSKAAAVPRHLVAVTDAAEVAGAERALGELLAHLDPNVAVTVASVDPVVGQSIAAHRPKANLVVLPPLRTKADIRNAARVRKTLRDLQPSALHLNKTEVGGLRYVEAIARSIPAVRVVSVVHHVEAAGSILSGGLCRLLARNADATVAVGVSLARDLEEILHLEAGRVVPIPNALPAVNTTRRQQPHRQDDSIFTVGALTRMVPHKRVGDLIQAMPVLDRTRLIVAGTGPDLDELKALAVELNVDDRVEFPGWVDAEAILSRLDVYVLASEIEGYPVALLEAQRAGLPAVGSNAGGVAEIINDGIDGYLFEPGDVDGLADKLRLLRDNIEMRQKMACAARKAAALRPGPDEMAKAYAALYWPLSHSEGNADSERNPEGSR